MSGPQLFISRVDNDGTSSEIEKELEQTLLLVRLSTMKMLRLQLAIERRDRAVALQAVEDLMDLDAWMAHSAGRSADDELMEAIAQEIAEQRSALLNEKFGLAAGMVKGPPREWPEPGPEQAACVPAATGGAHALHGQGHDFGPVEAVIGPEPAAARSGWWAVFLVILMAFAMAVGAALFLGGDALFQGGL